MQKKCEKGGKKLQNVKNQKVGKIAPTVKKS